MQAQRPADILAISEIEPGDALVLATRFAMQWAYRGGQALLWNKRFIVREIRDLYLPIAGAGMFGRRGFLRVDGSLNGEGCTLVATHLSSRRERRIPELRFMRAHLRACEPEALAFIQSDGGALRIEDLGFYPVEHERAQFIFARGISASALLGVLATV
jgi:endonuclease/exonuclease/phosphatase family metal-dependent hydrolase